MSQPNRPRPRATSSAQSNLRTLRDRRPPKSAPERATRMYTGLFLLAVLLVSLFSLIKPLAPRTEYLIVTAPEGTTEVSLTSALTTTGALPAPGAVRVSDGGDRFTVASADAQNPVPSTTWRALERTLPGQLTGAEVEYRADPPRSINLGLDLQGGLRVVLQTESSNPQAEDVERVRTIIANRVDQTGVSEPLVQVQGNNRVVVELPGLSQAQQQQALRLIGQTAKLEFRIVNAEAAGRAQGELTLDDLGPVVLTGEGIRNAVAAFDQFGRPQVNMDFTPEGGRTFEQVTGANVGNNLAIVLDGQVMTAPVIQGRIAGGSGVINNISSVEEASETALVLRSGALPVDVNVIETRAIGPTLGQDAIRSGLLASVVGIASIFLLILAYYGLYFGIIATLGLLFSGIVIFGIFSGLGATLTLPGIAGLVLTVGQAVDGNVISFERIKEEQRAGKGLRTAIRSGFDHSFTTIFDANLTTLLAAIALYNYSTGPVRGFAVTLAVGVIVTTFSNLVVGRWLLEALASVRTFSARQWFATPRFPFLRYSVPVLAVTTVLALASVGLILTRGFVYGVDFTSGTAISLRTESSVASEQVRTAVGEAGIEGATAGGAVIVETQVPGSTGKDFTVRVGELDLDERTQLETALRELPGGQIIQTEVVGPAVGNELRQQTVWAVIVALGLILVYVAFRFEPIFGVAAIVATLHDAVIALGLYALLGREFSITTVAAILTLIGYSLNDTIIVSDRIRENLRLMRGRPYAEIMNVSINQTLSRTVMTSFSAALPLIALLVLGGPVLRDFSLTLLVGILVGTYSSVYVVAPLIVWFKEWQASRARRRPAGRARA